MSERNNTLYRRWCKDWDQDHECGHAVQAERAHKRRGLPVPVRHRDPAPLASWSTTTEPCHLCVGAAFIHKDQPPRVELGLVVELGLSAPRHVRTFPAANAPRFRELARVRRLF